MLKNGSNQIVIPNRKSVKTALLGNTSLVQNSDGTLAILYNEEIGEINIHHNGSEELVYDLDQIDSAVKNFLYMYEGM
jgi:hypothetical protein